MLRALVLLLVLKVSYVRMPDAYADVQADRTSYHHQLLILVSFSMPAKALENLFKEAEEHQGIILFRGMKDDHLNTHLAAYKSLNEKFPNVPVYIDPELFERVQAVVVPTYVYFKDAGSFYKMAGFSSAGYFLEKVKGSR